MVGQPTTSRPRRSLGRTLFVELVRLAIVVLATAGAFALADATAATDTARLVVTVTGVGVGYVLGGVAGRFVIGEIDVAEQRLRTVGAGQLLAAAAGGVAGLLLAFGLVWPVLLLGGKVFTLPFAALVVVVLAGAGIRLGAGRGGDLLRFLGASGRLPTPSRGSGSHFKLIDTSALIDGRVLDVCRSGFVDGILVVPEFVLYELQGLADAGDEERRRRGRRGLDVLTALQRSSGAALEVSDDDAPGVEAVDAKLVAVARRRAAALVTVDANLARIAEVQGVKVLNLHRLAEDLRPPVTPGDRLTVRISKPGREPGQGVGYLDDGTMVVVEKAADRIGREVSAEVTSLLANPNGRMIFASTDPPPRLVRADDG